MPHEQIVSRRLSEIPEDPRFAARFGVRGEPVAWEALVALEPRLLPLLVEAQRAKTAGATCANAIFYGSRGSGLKGRLSRLVGYLAPVNADPRLCTENAYDVAYHHIYDALPACTHEGIC